jgi:hypothetical protein
MFHNQDKNKVTIDSSGARGSDGAPGNNASIPVNYGYGYHGSNGYDGWNGANAGDINLKLSAVAGGTVALETQDGVRHSLILGDPQAEIELKAIGGNGGNGGPGGNGGRGSDGVRGIDATQYHCGTHGTNGYDGGNGGNGGCGGNGGSGGRITVSVNEHDTDLLMLLGKQEYIGGIGGDGGAGGVGGAGGYGGRGGSSYSWSEPVTQTHYDADGTPHYHTIYETHYSDGGSNGFSGYNGSAGRPGNAGINGKNGSFNIIVNGDGQYPGIYDLRLDSINEIQSDDGVIEPGRDFVVNGIKFSNIGNMPTPPNHPIHVSVIPNQWVAFNPDDTRTLKGPIMPNNAKLMTDSLAFRINPVFQPLVANHPLDALGTLQLNASLPRVNKDFKNVKNKQIGFRISYPVKIHTVTYPLVIARGEEANVDFGIHNYSTKPLGIDAPSPRLLEMSIARDANEHKLESLGMTFRDTDSHLSQTMAKPVLYPVRLLNAGRTAYIKGKLKFPDNAPSYTKIDMTFKLSLGELNNPAKEKQVIEVHNFNIQLAERYQYHPDADMVLVTNNNTDPDTVNGWIKNAATIGMRISVWNTSLYSGLSYTQKRNDQMSFADHMQGKVMVILNNKMNVGESEQRATDCLDAMEILDAAKNANVATYICGSDGNLKNIVTPLKQVAKNDPVFEIEEKYFFWRQPQQADLIKKAKQQNQKLHYEAPDHRYTPVVDFKPQRLDHRWFVLRPTWKVGTIEQRETLNLTQAHVALRAGEEIHHDNIDLFNVIKLLPFKKKLEYLDRVASDNVQAVKTIQIAILSDLTDELMAFAKDKWNGKFTSQKLTDAMVNLKQLSEYQFKSTVHLSSLLTQYDYFAKRLPTNWDKYLFPFLCRRTRLSKISRTAVKNMMKHHFPNFDAGYESEALHRQWGNVSREALISSFAKLPQNDAVFDNQLDLSEPVDNDKLPKYRMKKSGFTERFGLFANRVGTENHAAKQSSTMKFDV